MECTKNDLEGLSVKYVGVSSDSGQLHDACERLLAEQVIIQLMIVSIALWTGNIRYWYVFDREIVG